MALIKRPYYRIEVFREGNCIRYRTFATRNDAVRFANDWHDRCDLDRPDDVQIVGPGDNLQKGTLRKADR